MALVRWQNKDLYDPWAEMKSLQKEINDLFSIDHYPSSTGLFDRKVSPAIDVVEDDQNFTVRCELPGLESDDIDVSIAANVLTVKGNKKNEREEKRDRYYKKESWSGSFQRTLSLPTTVDPERISADLKDGILKITLPKKEEAKPKQISVNIK